MCFDEINISIILIWKQYYLKIYKNQMKSLILSLNQTDFDTNVINIINITFFNCQASSLLLCYLEFYSLALLWNTEALILETLLKSFFCHYGLLYCQFYNSCKEVFAAGNCYSFENKNINTLALNSKLICIWTYISWVISH